MIKIKLNFIKLSPAENTTVLVTNYVPSSLYSKLAAKIMAYTHLHAEQVGFIAPPQNNNAPFKLEMSGGEFCGNGVLAAGASAKYLELTDSNSFKLESSGVESPLDCSIEKEENLKYTVRSSMPLNYTQEKWTGTIQGIEFKGVLIKFDGITHLLLENKDNLDEELIETILKKLAKEIKAEALGVIAYQEIKGDFRIKPCVYVPKTGSLVFERGCGSGTLALGLYIANREQETLKLDVKQPGGIIEVEVVLSANNNIKEAFLKTEVDITCTGEVFV